MVGEEMATVFRAHGFRVIHDTNLYDYPSYSGAYDRSAAAVKNWLEQYPSISIVLDVHRDALSDEAGQPYRLVTTEVGRDCAQVMLVVGTNQNGRHPEWEKNLVVATAYKDTMDALYPSLSRSVYLRTARFNQECLPGCMLLEVGSAVNSLEEACTAARFAASAFASLLESKQ